MRYQWLCLDEWIERVVMGGENQGNIIPHKATGTKARVDT